MLLTKNKAKQQKQEKEKRRTPWGKNIIIGKTLLLIWVNTVCSSALFAWLLSISFISLFSVHHYLTFHSIGSWVSVTATTHRFCLAFNDTQYSVLVLFCKNCAKKNEKILRTNICTPNAIALTEWREFCELM